MGKKRAAEQILNAKKVAVHGETDETRPNVDTGMSGDESEGMGEFEDAWEDEIESDGEVIDGADEEDEDGVVDMDVEADHEKEPAEPTIKVYLPGQKLEDGEELVHDASAYHMLHSMSSRWPCLSFDILPDRLGAERSTYPHTVYSVAGTQADQAEKNELYVMKMSQLNKTMHDDGDSDSDSDDGVDDDPILEHRAIPHYGGVNRIRITSHSPEGSTVAATWAETGKVHLWDLSAQMMALDVPGTVIPHEATRPIYTVGNHGNVEGFAMDWSTIAPGRLLTGDISGRIFYTTRGPAGYHTAPNPFTGHTSSVEDIQFSPTEKTVFASCSADGTIRIWDTRSAKRRPVIGIQGSQTDLNVISWNQKVAFFIASGSDDGEIAVWDIRKFEKREMSTCTPVATFRWHNAPVTAIEWSPHEESVLAAAGADDQVSIWDLSVEADTEEREAGEEEEEVPPQLLFVHQGQKDIKDLHWHKNIPGAIMTTAGTGFNVFKPMNF